MSMRLGRRAIGALTAALIITTPLAACSSGSETGEEGQSAVSQEIAQAAEVNRAHEVAARFAEHPEVVDSASGSGVEASRTFFEAAEGVVLASPDLDSQLRAASVAVAIHTPLLVAVPGSEAEVADEIDRLGASTIYTVGEVYDLHDSSLTVIRDASGRETLEKSTGLNFTPKDVTAGEKIVEEIAALDSEQPADLKVAFEAPKPPHDTPGEDGTPFDNAATDPAEADEEVPGAAVSTAAGDEGSPGAEAPDDAREKKPAKDQDKKSERDNKEATEEEHSMPVAPPRQDAPIVVASPGTAAVDVANAKAYGADVRVMDFPDPRINDAAHKAVAGLADQPLIALGAGFGPAERLSRAIELAGEDTPELPGGGNLVFPGRRMIALYGHPSGGDLGVMGEFSPEDAVNYAEDLVAEYQAEDPDEKVIPAFEIISTVASSDPGEDNDYSNEADPEELIPYIDAVTEAGGYAVIDLQPGRASLLEQAKLYEDLLKRPDVGLALDPEWKIGPDEQPLSRVGNVEADEISEVADWLAGVVRENNLPQKLFMVHQFQLQMIRDRETVDLSHAELAYVLHADGHGDPETKFGTWNVMRQDLSPVWLMAWKNFIDEDIPTFTPEQTFAIEPQPWFVSYQ